MYSDCHLFFPFLSCMMVQSSNGPPIGKQLGVLALEEDGKLLFCLTLKSISLRSVVNSLGSLVLDLELKSELCHQIKNNQSPSNLSFLF